LFLVTKEVRAPGPGEEPEEKSCKMGLVNLTSFVGEQNYKSKPMFSSIMSAKTESKSKSLVRSKSTKSRLEGHRSGSGLRKTKTKTPAKIDRLSEDKEYLSVLANGIGKYLLCQVSLCQSK
jgi:hypothetical protein